MEEKTSSDIEYKVHHWSKKKDSKIALEIYKDRYKDIYNKLNVKKIVNYIDNDKSLNILDYGGGIGIVSVQLAKNGHKVTLADQSSEALKAAKLFCKEEGVLSSVEIVKCQTASYNFKQKFDIIIAKDLIEHVIEDYQLISDFHNNLIDGGSLIMTTQNSFSLNYIIEGTIRKIIHPKTKWLGWDRTHIRFYTPMSLKKVLLKNKFKNIHYRGTYIIPYKLIDLFFQRIFRIKKTTFLWRIDWLLHKSKLFSRAGWNIMVISKKIK